MTSTQNYPIKLEPVEDVILEIKTIQTNIHKIIQDDFDDEDVSVSIVPSFNYDDANKIKMEPAVDYTLELNEDIDCEDMDRKHDKESPQNEKHVNSSKSRGIKRRHTAIMDEMLDVSKEESLEKRIKKRPRRSNTKEVKKGPETEIRPENVTKSPSKSENKTETSKTDTRNSDIRKKDSRVAKNKRSQKSSKLDHEKVNKDDLSSKKSSRNQKITNYFEADTKSEEIKQEKSKNEKKKLKISSKATRKLGKATKIAEDQPKSEEKMSKIKDSSSQSTKTDQLLNKSSKSSVKNEQLPKKSNKSTQKPKETPIKRDNPPSNSKKPSKDSKISKSSSKLKHESSSDTEPDNYTEFHLDSQDSESSSKFDQKLNLLIEDHSTQASSNDPTTSTHQKFDCKKCNKLFGTKLKLYYHSKTHLPKVECKICGRKIQAYLLRRHLRYHYDNKPFKCDLCPKSFISFVSIRNHMYKHTSVKKFYCDVCGRGYNDSRHLREHKLGHTNPLAYRCDLCPKGYERKQALEAHMHANHMEDTKWYACKICGYKTKMLTVMYSHRKRHDKTIPCEDCGKKFSNKSELQDHSLAIHVKVKDVECRICGKFFASKRYMLKHIRRTHGESKFKFFCVFLRLVILKGYPRGILRERFLGSSPNFLGNFFQFAKDF